ncbi:uncharacterized protein LOC133185729 [Saccostrea echinata]|uniref:uncharacterized protein LOC133185729 n=1 Tax=Saccostrea echinata TaxID=191078 RepID=UPI002A806BA0|nr:uncharacterized protein LOC133185729 [Saccostrea echinata]
MDEASTKTQIKESFSKDTQLHTAIKETRHDLLQMLFFKGPASDVNSRNRWGQTPLHYAAVKTFILENLLAVPNCDPRIQDINGYNVLHCYIYNILTHDDWRRVIKILLSFDIDINKKTKCGNTILHLACKYGTPPSVLRYLLETFPHVDKLIVNDDCENFLHTLVQSLNRGNSISDDLKEKFALLDDIISQKISLVSSNVLKTSLQQQDINGATPFLLLLSHFGKYRRVNALDVLKKMSSLSDCSTTPDNLSNYPIHIAYACSQKATPFDLLKTLVKLGNSADSKNIFQQSVAHLMRMEEGTVLTSDEKIKSLLNLEKAAKVDFNCRDRWLSTPLMYISAWCDSDCFYTLNELSDNFSVIDARDENGATALHYAACHDAAEFAMLLIEKGAKTDIKDKMGDTPLDTARRNYSSRTEELILKSTGSERMYNNQGFLLNLERIRHMKPIQWNETDEFVDQLLQHMYRQVSDEDNSIISTIRYFVGVLCSKVEEYDPRFRMSVLQSGSSSEGTKAGAPDEFDFLLCLDAFSEITEIFQRTSRENNRNIFLKLKDPERCEFLEYFDGNGTFTTPTAFTHLNRYLRRAVHDPNMWQDKKLRNLCYVFEQPFLKKDMNTTVFMIHLTWMGCQYKHLQIKIDMVPVIRKPAWWPIDPYSLTLMSPEIHDAGCLLMLDTKDELQTFTSDYLKEFTMDSINRIEPISTSLLVSTAPAEIRLMQSLPKRIRESYVAAKLLVNMCREDDFTSYMLKNCTFYVLRDLGWDPNEPEGFDTDLSARELTILIFKKFLKFNKEGCLPRFFLPEIDIFLEDDDRLDQRSRRRAAYSLLIIMGDEDASLDKLAYDSESNDDSEDTESDLSDSD